MDEDFRSGETEATEASLDKKGSCGFKGGIGILAELLQLKFAVIILHLNPLLLKPEEEEEHNIEAMGICRELTMFDLLSLSLSLPLGSSFRVVLENEIWDWRLRLEFTSL